MDQFTPPVRDDLAEAIFARVKDQGEQLRIIDDKVTLILAALTPKESDGPTLDDILARMVTLVTEQRPLLRRIDSTTGRSLDLLEGRLPTRPDQEETSAGRAEPAGNTSS